jgi:hypothetical protein
VELSEAVRHAALFPETDLPAPPPGSPSRRVEVEGVCVFLPSTHPLGMVFPEQLEEERIEHVIGATRELLTAEGRGKAIWSVPEAAKPSDLAERLRAFGMRPCDEPGVEERHAEMVSLEAPPPGPPAVVARKAATFDEFLTGMLVVTEGIDMDPAVRTAIEERAEQMWTFQDAVGSNVLFVALVDDKVIGMGGARFGRAAVYLGGAVTHPEHRGSGAYRALVRARWDAAIEHGTPVLTVGAGAMSRPILERLGFSVVGWTENLVEEF